MTSTSSNKPEKGDLGETRRSIIRTAHDLFMELGYRAVSTRKIADSCGLTQPALYHHFSNKKELYVEVIKTTIEKTQVAIERILKQYDNMRDQLLQFSTYMMMNHHEDLNQMFHDIEHELDQETQDQIYQWWMKGYLLPVVAIFEKGQQDGQLKNQEAFGVTPMHAAHYLLSLIKSSMEPAKFVPRKPNDRKKDAEKKSEMIVDVLLFGLTSDSFRKDT
ncbi:TetR/AcrR family transcriptional regulator [Falsibacillus albus]|uniref:TetR/AcrR family transcriptional regulator n=1 Tax=Falsibacillus albus TaxID=2478915 RepID=A0A3L7JT84_9BACI|nr:TetR/AcrR family transcriptional regulator [Falsibacillus albus]RLQ94077.1 TetR/AcrR family transcriptional regulator [Falsibacillus albus]